MKTLWEISGRIVSSGPLPQRQRCFLYLNSIVSGLAGLLLWLIVRCFALDSIDWLICFAGYPAMFYGVLGGAVFLMTRRDHMEE